MDNIESLHLNADYFHTNNPLNLLADSHDLILDQRNSRYHQSSLFTPEIDNLLAIVDDAAKNILTEFVAQPHQINQLQTAFGTNWQTSTVTNIITDWLTGQQSPQLTIVSENQLYAQGAYSQANFSR